MKAIQFQTDANARVANTNGNFHQASDTNYVLLLATGVAKSVTVPAGATKCIIKTTTPMFMKVNAAATVPVADAVDGTASELVVSGSRNLSVVAADTISVIFSGTGTQYVTFSFYA